MESPSPGRFDPNARPQRVRRASGEATAEQPASQPLQPAVSNPAAGHQDLEVRALADIVAALNRLDVGQQARALTYLNDRYAEREVS